MFQWSVGFWQATQGDLPLLGYQQGQWVHSEGKEQFPQISILTLKLSETEVYFTGVFISVRKRYLFSPLLKILFFPLSKHIIFRLPSWPFCLNSSLCCIYFILLLPLSHFLSPFFLFSLFPFSFTFSPFFSPPYYIFSQMTSADIPLWVFSNIFPGFLKLFLVCYHNKRSLFHISCNFICKKQEEKS